MKKALKILIAASLLIMSMPFMTHANNVMQDEEDILDGFIFYSPAPPQDWTQDQWRQWGEALDDCLVPALYRAQGLVADARALLAAAGVTTGIVPSGHVLASLGGFVIASPENLAAASSGNIDLTPRQIELLLELISHYEDLYERIQNFLYAFQNTELDFEIAIAYMYELCDALLLLEFPLIEEAPTESEPPGQPSLPQTGTAVALTSIGVVGIALTIIGAISAHAKKNNKNS